ncbi:30S ribosomal protein S13 [Candidatus Mesenet endosymbiont of Agriotes lineatus]|uniref:30S ribosomal protein S13 n=1 Tax=Candidatus Mesenet endosymbiont of Agriotes lineatus TaxID=3077948 RepID=UPI0030D25427
MRKVSSKVAGVDLPLDKCVPFSLAYIKGVGVSSGNKICEACGISKTLRVSDLTDEQINAVNGHIRENYVVDENLKDKVSKDIRLLVSIGCYRGVRHRMHLPTRGQRTHSNAKTCRRLITIKR